MATTVNLLDVAARAARFVHRTVDDMFDILVSPLEDFVDDRLHRRAGVEQAAAADHMCQDVATSGTAQHGRTRKISTPRAPETKSNVALH